MEFGKYNLIDTVDKLKALDKLIMEGDKNKHPLMAVDTETTGLRVHKVVMVGFSLSFNSDSGFYVPLLRWVPDPSSLTRRKKDGVQHDIYEKGHLECVWSGKIYPETVSPKEYKINEIFPLIPALCKRWFTSTNLTMQNAPFDCMIFRSCMGLDLAPRVFSDTALRFHILDENSPTGLKKRAEMYKEALGINPYALAAVEKKELDYSILINGGKKGQVHRADLAYQSKYACADTFLTYALDRITEKEFASRFGRDGLEWFYRKEVMPLCREVVVDMKYRGVYIDVDHFQKLYDQNAKKLLQLEDQFIDKLNSLNLINEVPAKSVDEVVSTKRFLEKLIELENLKIPTRKDKKTGKIKPTLAKAAVKKAYQENPHWVWGYVLGEDEIRYSDEKVAQIKAKLYEQIEGRRYVFSLTSPNHLVWLFCTKLGFSESALPKTASGRPQLTANSIKEFLLPKYPWVSTLLKYRKLQKLQTTYIKPALDLHVNGWLYMDMNQTGTTSGRFSCSGGYNLQTLPRVDDELEILEECDNCHSKNIKIHEEIECMADRECLDCKTTLRDIPRPSSIKKGFIAPPGYKIVAADYSSLEPRCFAYQSGETKLKEIYWNNLDMYSKVYCDVFDKEGKFSPDPKASNFLKKVAPAKRKWTKPWVLGIPYGSSDYRTAELIGAFKPLIVKGKNILDDNGKPVMIPDEIEGARVREAYLSNYENLKAYMEEQEEKAVTLGYVETILGRRRHLPFAKKINDVLIKNDVDWKDFVQTKPKNLKSPNVTNVSNRGYKYTLTSDMLEEIRTSIGIKKETLNGLFWAKIRSLLRSDLNNSKNNPIQGLAVHITNKGMLETTRLFRQKNIDAWVCLQVHDEIISYVREDQAQEAAECLQLGMEKNEFTQIIDIDMIAEPVICDNLKESK